MPERPLPNPCPKEEDGLTYRREVRPSDRACVRAIVEATGFFSRTEEDIAVELVDEHLARGERESGYYFLFAEAQGEVLGYTCFGPILGTAMSYDLFWIAVLPRWYRRGIGRKLLAESERLILLDGGRRVYVETSSRPQYETTRAFYRSQGYREDAFLQDFYAPGDGKVIYVKSLVPGEVIPS